MGQPPLTGAFMEQPSKSLSIFKINSQHMANQSNSIMGITSLNSQNPSSNHNAIPTRVKSMLSAGSTATTGGKKQPPKAGTLIKKASNKHLQISEINGTVKSSRAS